jgi:hypothetical protein
MRSLTPTLWRVAKALVVLASLGATHGVADAQEPAYHHHSKAGNWIGTEMLTPYGNNAVCRAALNPEYNPVALFAKVDVPGWASNDIFDGPTLLPSGRLLMGCGREINGYPEMIVDYDMFKPGIIWEKPIERSATYQTTYNHLFRLDRSVTPAHGLRGSSVKEYVTAFSMKTGKWEWEATIPALGYSRNKGPGNAPIEGLSEGEGSPQQVVIQDSGTTAFDPATGKVLWTTASETFNDVGSSTAVEYSGEGPFGEEGKVSASDIRTGATRWTAGFDRCADAEDSETVGTVRWELGGSCVRAFDLLTGAQHFYTAFPEGWEWTATDRTGVVAATKDTISYYKLTDLGTPVWSEPAVEARPKMIDGEYVFIEDKAGYFILSLVDGKIAAEVPDSSIWFHLLFRQGPVGGLISTTRENGYTIVLDIDRP